MCFTDRYDMTLAVKVALNLNATNQSKSILWLQKNKGGFRLSILLS